MSDHENKKREEDRWWEDDPAPQDKNHENNKDSEEDKQPPETEPDKPDDEEKPRRIDPAQIIKIALTDINKPAEDRPDSMLNIKRSDEWMDLAATLPEPTMLFDEFWSEGEISILFADTNAGKSILAVQIANSISRGEAVPGFRLEAKRQRVLYFDFELSCKQYERRYTNNYKDPYVFHPNMYRAELHKGMRLPAGCDSFEDCLIMNIEEAVVNRNVKVLVIDNLTYLRSDNERARDASPLMQQLMDLKTLHGLSILILAHTPKRDMSTPLTLNHLQGSKMLMNFCDSSFCIGTSTQDKSMRYLKQVKVRSDEFRYHGDNVALCRIEKPHNFLGFTYMGCGSEREHLREKSEGDKAERDRQIRELHEEGLSQQKIADKLGIGVGTVNRVLNK